MNGPGRTFFHRTSSRATKPASSWPANAPYVPTMTFDVASVRENENVDVNAGITMSGQFVPNTTKLRVINWPIENLISYAYGLSFYQIEGAPKWPFTVCDRGQGRRRGGCEDGGAVSGAAEGGAAAYAPCAAG
jgi:hypothetical protein